MFLHCVSIQRKYPESATACLQGMQAAINLGISNAVLETDALKVRQAWSSYLEDFSTARNLISEMEDIVARNFATFDCVFSGRECNKVPHMHALAEIGCECGVGDDPIFWTFFQVVFIVYLPQI
jgi:hypothetical protein